MNNEETKRRTLELYDQLPQDYEERIKRIDIRDELLRINYKFFGYVASHTFINNSSIDYQDKFQCACCAFLEMWWKYKYEAKYRTDLSFAVFFKPRIGEVIERKLNTVKYSTRRSLTSEVGNQIGKHWSKVTYDDLSDSRVHLSNDKLNSLKAIFGSLYPADLEKHEIYIPADPLNIEKDLSDNYDSIEDLLIHEMICNEEKLTDKKLLELSNTFNLNYWDLKKALPHSEKQLYNKLHESIDILNDTI